MQTRCKHQASVRRLLPDGDFSHAAFFLKEAAVPSSYCESVPLQTGRDGKLTAGCKEITPNVSFLLTLAYFCGAAANFLLSGLEEHEAKPPVLRAFIAAGSPRSMPGIHDRGRVWAHTRATHRTSQRSRTGGGACSAALPRITWCCWMVEFITFRIFMEVCPRGRSLGGRWAT